MKVLVVIPARLASTRLPGKLLLAETGRTMIEHTYTAASKSVVAHRVMVAADDLKIVDAVKAFGGEVVMTRDDHQSGTDRVAEVAAMFPDFDLIVNVQGDEPEIDSTVIDAAVGLLKQRPDAVMSTVAVGLHDSQLLSDPSCVKVVLASDGSAIYFSRSQIPFPRNLEFPIQSPDQSVYFHHVGIYVYRREFLLQFSKMAMSKLERAESLEQLRVIENGHKIVVAIVKKAAKGIDTAEDYKAFVRRQSS